MSLILICEAVRGNYAVYVLVIGVTFLENVCGERNFTASFSIIELELRLNAQLIY